MPITETEFYKVKEIIMSCYEKKLSPEYAFNICCSMGLSVPDKEENKDDVSILTEGWLPDIMTEEDVLRLMIK